jgi:phosphatidylserine/phosphatidylglycerophosphate/cardiolipin synthase-like enzyme
VKNLAGEKIEKNYKIPKINYLTFTSPPSIWETYKSSLESTKQNLYVEIYDITRKEIKKTLKQLAEKGVDIKISMENKKYKQYSDTFGQLKNYLSGYKNVEIKSDKLLGTKYLHSKLVLKDNCFWIQTANRTYSSFFKNREDWFYSCDS